MKRSVPGPGGNPILGNTLALRKDPIGFLTGAAREYGDIVRLRVAHQILYLVTHPRDVEQVLVSQSSNFFKTGREPSFLLRWLLADDLLARVVSFPSDGEFWTRERDVVRPALHSQRVSGYTSTMTTCAQRMIGNWEDGEIYEIHHEMMKLGIETVAQTLFGADASKDVERIIDSFEVVTASISARMMNPFQVPVFLPTSGNRALRQAVEHLSDFFQTIVHAHREGTSGDDLISVMVQAFAGGARRMSESYWQYQAMTLFIAAYETTALGLTWACYLLSQNQAVERELVAELDSVLGGGLPSTENLSKLRYTDAVIRESLRLYPPVWLFGARKAKADCVLAGETIPAGSLVLICPATTQRDGRFFVEPDAFRPGRWPSGNAKDLPAYAYFPFSAGPRHCIGHTYAMTESVLALASVYRQFHLELEPGHQVVPEARITLRPKYGLRMRATRRLQARHQ